MKTSLASPLRSGIELTVDTVGAADLCGRLPEWRQYLCSRDVRSLNHDPVWLTVMDRALSHRPYCLEARRGELIVGLLPLAFVTSRLFGRFLVGLPFVSSGGVCADDDLASTALIDAAVALADRLDVRYLELRSERLVEHPSLTQKISDKVHMRRDLPGDPDDLWKSFPHKVRNQVRKAERVGFTVHWGREDLLDEFYAVHSRNMRDLGTPANGRNVFAAILAAFPEQAELCVLRHADRPVAVTLLLHAHGVTEALRSGLLADYRPTAVNMLLQWRLLQRAMQRGNKVYDFGRTTVDSSVYRFKKLWGGEPQPAPWQYYVRKGRTDAMRRKGGKFGLAIRLWQRFPLMLANLLGPPIARGIP